MVVSNHYEIVDRSGARATQVLFTSASDAAEHLMRLGLSGLPARHLSVAHVVERVERQIELIAPAAIVA